MKTRTPSGTLCRLEELRNGVWTHLGDHTLLHPEKVAPRYAAHGKVARVTELSDDLQPTGRVHQVAPELCALCETEHPAPHDGSCLL